MNPGPAYFEIIDYRRVPYRGLREGGGKVSRASENLDFRLACIKP